MHEAETLPENDRVRYTISPMARKEVLRRLPALSHQRAVAQTATVSVKKKHGKGGKGTLLEPPPAGPRAAHPTRGKDGGNL